jgi:hypothetical protein
MRVLCEFRTNRTGYIDLFILKNMGAAIIDFRVCPPFVKCKNLMFSGNLYIYFFNFRQHINLITPFFLMIEKQQKKKKEKKCMQFFIK